jgi:hypothetical protein
MARTGTTSQHSLAEPRAKQMGFQRIDTASWDKFGNFWFKGLTDDSPPTFVLYTYTPMDGWYAWLPSMHHIDPSDLPSEVLDAFERVRIERGRSAFPK